MARTNVLEKLRKNTVNGASSVGAPSRNTTSTTRPNTRTNVLEKLNSRNSVARSNNYGIDDDVWSNVQRYSDTIGDYNWRAKYDYDLLDSGDIQRKEQGRIPYALEKRYDLNDVLDRALYYEGLPSSKDLASVAESAQKAAVKAAEEQRERERIAAEYKRAESQTQRLNDSREIFERLYQEAYDKNLGIFNSLEDEISALKKLEEKAAKNPESGEYKLYNYLAGVIDKAGEKKEQGANWYKQVLDAEDFEQYAKQGAETKASEFFSPSGRRHNAINLAGAADDATIAAWRANDSGETAYTFMSDDERGIYNYLYAKEGKDAAGEYLKTLEPELNKRWTSNVAEGASRLADESPVFASALSVGASIPKAAGAAYAVFDTIFDSENPDAYHPTLQAGALQGAVRGNISNDLGSVGGFLYNTGMSIMDTMLTHGVGGKASLGIMGAGAMADTYQNALERGANPAQALAVGTVAGVSEALFEKISIDRWVKLDSVGRGAAVKNILKTAGIEATEEMTTEIANIVTDMVILGELGETHGKSFGELLGQVGLSGLGGALSGGAFGGLSQVTGRTNANRLAQQQAEASAANDGQIKKTPDTGDFTANQAGSQPDRQMDIAVEEGTTTDAAAVEEAAETPEQRAAEEAEIMYIPNVTQYRAGLNRAFTRGGFSAAVENELKASGLEATPQNRRAARDSVTNQLRGLKQLGERYDVKIAMHDTLGDGVNGYFDPKTGVVHVALDAVDNAYMYVGTHELVHYVKSNNADGYTQLEQTVMDALTAGGEDVDALVKYQMDSFGYDEVTAREEIVANSVPSILTDENIVRQLTQGDRTVAEKIMQFVRDLVQNLKSVAARLTRQQSWRQVESLSKDIDTLNEIYDSFRAALEDAAVSDKAATGEVKNSPRLPADFGDTQDIEANYRTVASMEPVAELTGKEFPKGEKRLLNQVAEYFESVGGSVEHPELGTIRLTKSGARKDIKHGIGNKKAVAFAAVPEVLRKGKVIEYHYNWKGRKYDTATVAAPVTVAGERSYVAAILLKTSDDDVFYLHEIETEGASSFTTRPNDNRADTSSTTRPGDYRGGTSDDAPSVEGTSPFKTGDPVSSDYPGGDVPSIRSILQKIFDYKGESDGRRKYSAKDPLLHTFDQLEQDNERMSAQIREQQQVIDALNSRSELAEKREAGLRKAYETARGELKRTEGVKPDAKKAAAAAARIAREYGTKYDRSTLTQDLQDIFEGFYASVLADDSNVTDVVYSAISQRVHEVAKGVAEGVSVVNSTVYEDTEDMRGYFRSSTIGFDEGQIGEIEVQYGSLNAYRKALFGKVNISKDGPGIDGLWVEISELYPEYFPPDTVSGDQPRVLFDVLQGVYDRPVVQPYANDQDAIGDIEATIWDAVLSVPERQTFADRQAAKLDKAQAEIRDLKRDMRKQATQAQKDRERAVWKAEQESRAELSRQYNELKKEEDLLVRMVEGRARIEEINKYKAEIREIKAKAKEKSKAQTAAKNEAVLIERYRQHEIRDRLSESWQKKYDELWEQDTKVLMTQARQLNERLKEIREIKTEARERYKQMTAAKHEAVAVERYRQHEIRDRANARREATTERNKYRTRAYKTANELLRWLTNPNEKQRKYVPEALRNTTANFLRDIQFGRKEWRENLLSLQSAMQRIDNAGYEGDVYFDIDPDAIITFGNIAEMYKDVTSVAELDVDGMRELSQALAALKHAITNANVAHTFTRNKYISDAARETMSDLYNQEVKTHGRLAQAALNLLNVEQLDSFAYFHRLGKSAEGNVGAALRGAFDKKVARTKQGVDYMNDLLKDVDVSKLSGRKAEVKTFELPRGTVKMTTAQIMELYLLNKRAQAQGHLYDGGFRLVETTARDDGKKTRLKMSQPIEVTPDDVKRITDTLSNEEKAIADAVQMFLGKECAAWGNEVSMTLYGYKKFTETNYYPIRSDTNYTLTQENESGSKGGELYRLRNLGMTKATVQGANNPLVVGDMFDTFTRHVDEMATYNAFVAPLSDAMKWFNFRVREDGKYGGSVKQSIERAVGAAGKQYFVRLMKDINGITEGYGLDLTDRLVSNAKAASVGANVRVVLQQPTAYLRAASEIGPQYLARGAFIKGGAEKALKYCPVALWKSWGFFDLNTGRSMRELIIGDQTAMQKTRENAMKLAQKADEITFGALWGACELEVMDKRPELKRGSEEFNQAVGARLSEIIDKTQVVDTVLHRSQLMRNKDGLVKLYTSFMSEPTKSYNMLHTAMTDWYLNPGKEAARRFGRVAITHTVTTIATAAAAALADATRGDEDDKTWGEKYVKAFGENAVEGMNPLGMIPVLRDVNSLLSGYRASRMDMQSIEKVVNAATSLYKTVDKGEPITYKQVYNSVVAISSVSGIPVGNLMREFNGIYTAITGRSLTE